MLEPGLTFDLDDTLWDAQSVIRHAESRLHAWLARCQPRVAELYSPAGLREVMRAVAADEPGQAHDFSYLRRVALARAARAAGYRRDLSAAGLDVFLRARNEVVLFGDVLPVLTRLRNRHPMASITNGNADVSATGLRSYFAATVSAAGVGYAKPHPAPFFAACTALGRDPGDVFHIGDDPQSDIAGAGAAGLRTVWLNRKGTAWPGGRRPDLELRSLAELETALAGLRRATAAAPARPRPRP